MWADIFHHFRWINSIHLLICWFIQQIFTECLLIVSIRANFCLYREKTAAAMEFAWNVVCWCRVFMPPPANPLALDNFRWIVCLPRLLVTSLRTRLTYLSPCLAQWFFHTKVQKVEDKWMNIWMNDFLESCPGFWKTRITFACICSLLNLQMLWVRQEKQQVLQVGPLSLPSPAWTTWVIDMLTVPEAKRTKQSKT